MRPALGRRSKLPGVEVVRRRSKEAAFLFILDLKPEPTDVRIGGRARNPLSGEDDEGALALDPLDVAILEEARE